MNFIILIDRHTTTICICIESFTTTYRSTVTDYSNYEIHSSIFILTENEYLVL